jgi:hypothetical protein
MVRTSYCAARNCADSTWSNAVRVAVGFIYPLRSLDFHPGDPLLRPFIQEPAGIGL